MSIRKTLLLPQRCTSRARAFSRARKMKAAATGAVMQISLLLLLLCAPLLLLFGPASAQFSDGGSGNSPTVNTNYGRVRGYTQDIGVGRTIASYIGIPFAAAPTRGNRFRVSCVYSDSRAALFPLFRHVLPSSLYNLLLNTLVSALIQ